MEVAMRLGLRWPYTLAGDVAYRMWVPASVLGLALPSHAQPCYLLSFTCFSSPIPACALEGRLFGSFRMRVGPTQ